MWGLCEKLKMNSPKELHDLKAIMRLDSNKAAVPEAMVSWMRLMDATMAAMERDKQYGNYRDDWSKTVSEQSLNRVVPLLRNFATQFGSGTLQSPYEQRRMEDNRKEQAERNVERELKAARLRYVERWFRRAWSRVVDAFTHAPAAKYDKVPEQQPNKVVWEHL
jgi:hypothetical protein